MRILYVTTIGATMNFFEEQFRCLTENGHTVELACNSLYEYKDCIKEQGLKCHNVSFSRSPLSKDNLKAYMVLKNVIKFGNYDIVHCHTPNAAAITRLCCRKFRKKGLKVVYTAHGFHFFKGAPLKNWLL